MGHITSSIHTLWIASHIAARHTKTGVPRGITHILEDTMVNTLNKSFPRIYVHWGAYESGKSRAASNAQLRLQEMGKLVMLVHGWDFTYLKCAQEWLRVSVRVPEDRAQDRISMFLPGDKQAVLIIDHADLLVKRYGENDILEAVSELDIPVLMLFTSWERAVDMLKHYGCKLLGDEPGLGRWNSEDLAKLYDLFPKDIKNKADTRKDELHRCALLSGSPGILQFETYTSGDSREPSLHRAQLIDTEWKNGIRALNGENIQGITGRFPDKDHVFHWDDACCTG